MVKERDTSRAREERRGVNGTVGKKSDANSRDLS